jgi:formamidopyrimidine-DNA glycosylase
MPELPEVEIVRQNLERWWEGTSADEVVVHDEKLLVDVAADQMVDALKREMVEAWRRGKYLVAKFDDDSAVVFHFRMTGKIVCGDDPEPEYARLAWHVPRTGWLAFKDPRRLGRAEYLAPGELEAYEPFGRMGPEPTGLSGEQLRDILPENRLLKSALLDQDTIAGLGNIAVSEIFWRMGLPPRAKTRSFDDQQFDELADAIDAFVDETIAVEGGDEVEYLAEGRDDNPFHAYGRDGEPCERCGADIETVKVSGRTTYFCPECQGAQ